MKFISLLKRSSENQRHFDRITVGKFKVSIQASEYHYCEPRKSGLKPEEYTKFEMAIFDENDTWVVPPRDLKEMPHSEMFEDLESSSVAGYLESEKIQEILTYLETL